ncbi:MAG: heavy-metal-associated domain-containing protein [Verrucomicrobiales bacterium]|nr:heavy-metal-associated domain-containing protein [Verrucomicrobiales bacterium]
MKLIYSLSAILSLLFLFETAQAGPSSQTVQCEVPAMKCAGCSWSVTEALKKVEGVTAVHVDFASKTAIIEVDSAKAPGKEAIFAAVKTTGYDAAKYKSLDASFSEAKKKFEKSE